MGAPANSQINYSAPRVAARNIDTPASNININKALGLQSSPYEGLQQVGNQNLYYGDGGFYEPYSPSPKQYGRTFYGQFVPVTGSFGQPYQPSINSIYGYGGGITARGGDVAGTIRKDGQAFKPYTGDIPKGFVKVGDEYEPSMAYLYSKSQPNIKAQPNKMFSTVPGYQAATGSLIGNLAMSGTSGAGQFLVGNAPALNFGAFSGKSAGK